MPPTSTPREPNHWSMDKRVPLALIVTLILQGSGIVWWARGVQSDQENTRENHERRLMALEQSKERERVGERLATLETEMRNVSTVLDRIDARTQRILDTGTKGR